ncbi:MAG: alpha/beta hydrolase-fold protein [bacterium]
MSYCIITELYFPFLYPFKHSALWQNNDISSLEIGNQPIDASQIVKSQLQFSDGSHRRILIYLPKGYDQSNKNVRYPTYYLLHGSPDDETGWIVGGRIKENLDKYIDEKKIPPLIVVLPDGNGGLLNDSQYIDSTDGRQQTETFIAKILVDYIDSQLNTMPDSKHRVIGGLSSGGFGAINIGLKHQDRFGYIQSFSGYTNIEINSASQKLIQHSRGTVWANSPRLYLKNLNRKDAKVFLAVGKSDGYYNDNITFNQMLISQGFSSDLYTDDGWHTWIYWSKYFLKGLDILNANWQKNT